MATSSSGNATTTIISPRCVSLPTSPWPRQPLHRQLVADVARCRSRDGASGQQDRPRHEELRALRAALAIGLGSLGLLLALAVGLGSRYAVAQLWRSMLERPSEEGR